MERRSAIRGMVTIAGGMILFPACRSVSEKSDTRFKNIAVDAQQENLLAEIASVIIPRTDTLGAKEAGVHLFVLKMLDDMYESDVQQNFLSGLGKLDDLTKKRFDASFINCTADQKQKMLLSIGEKNTYPKEVNEFYKIMKHRTVEGYMNSEYVMTKVVIYEIIPTHKYNGYYRVKNV